MSTSLLFGQRRASMRALCLCIVIFIVAVCFASKLKQEGARVNYCNAKYLTDCYGITKRSRRGEPYKTNFTMTARYTWGNNVTIKVVLVGGISIEVVKTKVCDMQKIDWLFDYLKTYANLDGHCPYKPGQYGLLNMEFPPKNLPLRISNLMNGNFYFKFYLIVTKTEEIISEGTLMFRTM